MLDYTSRGSQVDSILKSITEPATTFSSGNCNDIYSYELEANVKVNEFSSIVSVDYQEMFDYIRGLNIEVTDFQLKGLGESIYNYFAFLTDEQYDDNDFFTSVLVSTNNTFSQKDSDSLMGLFRCYSRQILIWSKTIYDQYNVITEGCLIIGWTSDNDMMVSQIMYEEDEDGY